MPWNSDDAERHTKKADTDKKKRQWSHVANSARDRGEDDATAIREANSVVGKEKSIGRGGYRMAPRSAASAKIKTTYGLNSNLVGQNTIDKNGRKTKVFKNSSNVFKSLIKCAKDGVEMANEDDIEKDIGNSIAPYSVSTVRPFKRINTSKKQKSRVNSFKRRNFNKVNNLGE